MEIFRSYYKSIISLGIIFLFLSPRSAPASTYYVSAKRGADGNSGLSASVPWKSIAKVNSSVFKPGDRILFKRGDAWREQLIVPSSGIPAKPITFGDYGTGQKPLISGSAVVTLWSNYGGSVYVSLITWNCRQVFQNGQRLTMASSIATLAKGCWFQDPSSLALYIITLNEDNPGNHVIEVSQRDRGIFLYRKSYVVIKNFAVKQTNGPGAINIGQDSFENRIEFCELSYNGGNSILLEDNSFNNLVSKNTISYSSRPGGTAQFYNSCGLMVRLGSHNNTIIQNRIFSNLGSGVFIADTYGNLIRQNRIYDNGSGGIDVNGDESAHNLVLNNQVYKNGLIDKDEQGISFYMAGMGNLASGNVVHHQQGGADDGSGIVADHTQNEVVIERNIVFQNSGHGLSAWNSKGTIFRNNVSYGNSMVGIYVGGESSEFQIVNNIACANNRYQVSIQPEAVVAGGHFVSHNNLYKANTHIVADYYGIGYSSQEFDAVSSAAFSYQVEPRFVSPVSNFRLRTSSPCINKGYNIGLPFKGSAPDLGAWEIR